MDDHEKAKLDAGVIDRVLEASDQLLSERVARYVLERAALAASMTFGGPSVKVSENSATYRIQDHAIRCAVREIRRLDPATLAREARGSTK